jgi:hypothetical protein
MYCSFKKGWNYYNYYNYSRTTHTIPLSDSFKWIIFFSSVKENANPPYDGIHVSVVLLSLLFFTLSYKASQINANIRHPSVASDPQERKFDSHLNPSAYPILRITEHM